MNGRLDPNSVRTGSSVRNYTSIAFSVDYESLYAGSDSGDVSCIGIKHLSLELNFPACKVGVSSIAVGQKVRVHDSVSDLYVARPF